MDPDEIEMTREELQKFIREALNRRELLSPTVLRKYNQLQTLLEKKEKLSSDILQVFESVTKREASIRQLYSSLNWEYKNTDSEDDGNNDISNYEAPSDDAQTMFPRQASPAAKGISPLFPKEEIVEILIGCKKERPEPFKELRVVLTRLPLDTVAPLLQSPLGPETTLKREHSEDKQSNGPEADTLWQPSDESNDSDFSISNRISDRKKRRITIQEKYSKTYAQETSVQQPSTDDDASNTAPNVKPEVKSEWNPDVKLEVKTVIINDNVEKPAKQAPSSIPKDISVGLQVFGRRKRMRWESGKIAEIILKDDGTMKYKVTFEDKGKMLVSGHHIAYDAMPKLAQLSVGCRVVSKCTPDQPYFSPGILAELPSRKNHMRFLVFFDDHTSLYVALPALRTVCKPLQDPLDDIRDEMHKSFIREYLGRLPYPPQTQFRVGQKLKVELDGVLEPCSVVQVDSSLMEVVFAKDEHKEWIYRGSIRLEHIIKMKNDKAKK